MARPTKLTPAVERTILDTLRTGATRTAAFEAAGVGRDRIAPWMRRFPAFAGAVITAEASAEVRAAVAIRQAINAGGWRAAAWWLEHRRPDEWGKVDRIELDIRREAARIAEQTGADADWLVRRAIEIVEQTRATDPGL